MIGKVMVRKGFTGCISYCYEDKKIRNALAFECIMERIKGLPAILSFNFVFIYLQNSSILFKLRSKKSSFVSENLQNFSILFKTFQFSSRMFNFISKALKKAENFNAIERRELKYVAAQMQKLINDIKNYLQQ